MRRHLAIPRFVIVGSPATSLRAGLTMLLLLAVLGSTGVLSAQTYEGDDDERLWMPRNRIAANSPNFSGIQRDFLPFHPANGTKGNYYKYFLKESNKTWHTQHVVRLLNKNGRAYFMVSQSWNKGGWISLLETEPDAIDENDCVTKGGAYIWQDVYQKDSGSPTGGAWNHPCKMEVIGGLLLVSAQDWESALMDLSQTAIGNAYAGGSLDAVLFYDIRDPASPKYLGKMTADDLGIQQTSADGYDGLQEISVVALARFYGEEGAEYLLCVGGNHFYRTLRAKRVSLDVRDWTPIDNGGWDNPIADQAGMLCNSYEGAPRTVRSKLYLWEYEKVFNFHSDPEHDTLKKELVQRDGSRTEWAGIGTWFEGSTDHYDTLSAYVTRNGMVITYNMEADEFDDRHGTIMQMYGPNDRALRTPRPDLVVTNTNDSGRGSLRDAVGYGGTITFHPSLDNETINLTSGPIMVYLAHVTIDARALLRGITVVASGGHPSFWNDDWSGVSADTINVRWEEGEPVRFWKRQDQGGGSFTINRSGDLKVRHWQETSDVEDEVRAYREVSRNESWIRIQQFFPDGPREVLLPMAGGMSRESNDGVNWQDLVNVHLRK